MDNFLLLTCSYRFPFSFMQTGTNKDILSQWMFSSLTWLLKKVGPKSTLASSSRVLRFLLCSDKMNTCCAMTLFDSLRTAMKEFCRNYLPTQHHSELFCGRSEACLLWHLLWSGCGIGGAVLILTETRQCCFAFAVPRWPRYCWSSCLPEGRATQNFGLSCSLETLWSPEHWALYSEIGLRPDDAFVDKRDMWSWCCSFLPWHYPKSIEEKMTRLHATLSWVYKGHLYSSGALRYQFWWCWSIL